MTRPDIPQDKAELLSLLLESILYGFSLVMFGATMWALVFQRSTDRVNPKMFASACALLLCSTVHIVVDIIRVMQGLILYRDSPGGPIGFFSDPTQWTFVARLFIFSVQTLIGDGVLLYRCYIAWQSAYVMIAPVTLWIAIAVIGLVSPFRTTDALNWASWYYGTTLASNVLTTTLLAYRIWYVDRRAARTLEDRTSQLRPMLYIIIDAGLLYSFTIFSGLICFLNKSNGQSVVLDMVSPIISISFYMVIMRVGYIRARRSMGSVSLGMPSSSGCSNCGSNERGNRMRIQITSSTERSTNNTDNLVPMDGKNNWNAVPFDDQATTVPSPSSV